MHIQLGGHLFLWQCWYSRPTDVVTSVKMWTSMLHSSKLCSHVCAIQYIVVNREAIPSPNILTYPLIAFPCPQWHFYFVPPLHSHALLLYFFHLQQEIGGSASVTFSLGKCSPIVIFPWLSCPPQVFSVMYEKLLHTMHLLSPVSLSTPCLVSEMELSILPAL